MRAGCPAPPGRRAAGEARDRRRQVAERADREETSRPHTAACATATMATLVSHQRARRARAVPRAARRRRRRSAGARSRASSVAAPVQAPAIAAWRRPPPRQRRATATPAHTATPRNGACSSTTVAKCQSAGLQQRQRREAAREPALAADREADAMTACDRRGATEHRQHGEHAERVAPKRPEQEAQRVGHDQVAGMLWMHRARLVEPTHEPEPVGAVQCRLPRQAWYNTAAASANSAVSTRLASGRAGRAAADIDAAEGSPAGAAALRCRVPPPMPKPNPTAAAARRRTLRTLQERLGHTFADPALLERALTHASMRTRASPATSASNSSAIRS